MLYFHSTAPHLTRLMVTNLLSLCTEGNRGPEKGTVMLSHPVDWGQQCQAWTASPDIGKVPKHCPRGPFGMGWRRGYREHIWMESKDELLNRDAGILPEFPGTHHLSSELT